MPPKRWMPAGPLGGGREPSTVAAAVAGVVAIGMVAGVSGLLSHSLGHAAEALLLVVPVVATAALGGRRAAQVVAAVASLTFWLIVPPAGSLRVRFTDDTVAVVVFSIVAFAVGGLVAARIEGLGRIERQRAALLRSVSHDLRTPLVAIRAAASELDDDSPLDPAARRRMRELVTSEAERLDRLVANLLSLARIEGGALEPNRQVVNLAELADDCTHRLSTVLAATVVDIRIPPEGPEVLADYTLLDQVMTNLLENAARYSPPGEPVVITAGIRPGAVWFTVSDGGPGVPPDQATSIFEPFHSGRAVGIGGIGLAICKAVVEAHGGTIAVDGSTRGGAAFTVTLPGNRAAGGGPPPGPGRAP